MRLKEFFFDRQVVLTAVDRARKRVLSKFGSFVRRTARQSIRKRKRASLPGQPPSGHGKQLLKTFIYFGYDPGNDSVVIGPEKLGGSSMGEAPEVLEYGGWGMRKNTRRRRRVVGAPGEIEIGRAGGRSTKPVTDWHRRVRQVTYARLRTSAQAAHANRLNEELYGPDYRKQPAARPFMVPAFNRERPKLDALWADSVK